MDDTQKIAFLEQEVAKLNLLVKEQSEALRSANITLSDVQYIQDQNNFSQKQVFNKELVIRDKITVGQNDNVVILNAADATYRIYVGNRTPGSAAFRVTKAGVMTATGATINGTITASTFNTGTSGARVAITSGNDIELYDDTTGGGGTITGNVAELNMIRTDDSSKYFTLRKRAGKDNDSDNVMEFYATSPASGRYNVMFFGADGLNANNNVGAIQFAMNINTSNSYASLNGSFNVVVATNGTQSSTPHLFLQDARNVLANSGASGVVGILSGSGTDGFSALGFISGGLTYFGVYQDATTHTSIGLNLVPDTDDTYDLGASAGNWFRSIYARSTVTVAGTVVYKTITQPVIYYGRVSGTTIDRDNNSFTASNPSTGNYTITHNFSSTNYTVVATAIRASGAGAYTAKIESVNSDNFKVTIFDDTGSAVDGDFNFLLTKVV